MAERVLVSPGVFDREVDQTFLPADTSGIGAAFIGPRQKGPAMVPVLLKDRDADVKFFGLPSKTGRDFAAYASRKYLEESTVPATMIRVLGQEATGVTNGFTVGVVQAIGASGSGDIVAILHTSQSITMGALSSSISALGLSIPGYGSVTASLVRSDANYITKVLNTDPTQYSTLKHYVYAVYDYANKTPSAGVGPAYFIQNLPGAQNLADSFITSSATNVISQPFGATEYNLFAVGSRFAGNSSNTEFKVSISNIKKSPNPTVTEYGTFSLLVRKFDDTDKQPVVLESFSGLTLDPDSPSYICRVIGDRYRVWNTSTKKFDIFGDYENKSSYIYVTPTTDLKNKNVPATALPYGFAGFRTIATASIADKCNWPELPRVTNLMYRGDFSTKVFWGISVINNASGSVMVGVPDKLKHISKTYMSTSGTVESKFSLKWVSGSTALASGYVSTTRLTENQIFAMSTSIGYNTSVATPTAGSAGYMSLDNIENTDLAKFTFPVADGFDGLDETLSDPLSPENMASSTTAQANAYRTAIDILSNVDQFDVHEIVAPGVYASTVVNKMIDVAENRGDALAIVDISGSSVSDAVNNLSANGYDSSYACTYYPRVRLKDEVNGKIVEVPPTVIVPAVFAYNDKVSFAHFAPAGYTRGGLQKFGVVEPKEVLTKEERDRLYENNINPIASFPREGTVVWGQKTLQRRPSALDRINIRRMLLRARKEIAIVARDLVFEQNTSSTRETFVNRVTPYLERLRENSGLAEFRVIMDETNNTQADVERNILKGYIAIRPTYASEFIMLDFFVTNNVAGFTDTPV